MGSIVLSGFRIFGDYLANPTETVAGQLDGKELAGYKVCGFIFEATIPKEDRGARLLRFANKAKVKGIVSLGMASEKKGLCVESLAFNKICNEKYIPATLNNTPINHKRFYGESLTLDLAPWNIPVFQARCKEEGIPVADVSNDPGGYICNHLMYQVRLAQTAFGELEVIPFAFLHTPCSPPAVRYPEAFTNAGKITMTTVQIIRGLTLFLENAKL